MLIENEQQYEAALLEASAFFDQKPEPPPDSEQGKRFEALINAIERYENQHFPIEKPSRKDAAAFRREQERRGSS